MADKLTDVIEATVTSKGQITVPSEVRRALGLSAGDKLRFVRAADGKISLEARKRRSIIDLARARPIKFTEKIDDIDAFAEEGIALAMADKERRSRWKAKP